MQKLLFFIVIWSTSTNLFAQTKLQDFKRQQAIKNVTTDWHKIVLSDSTFAHVGKSLHDIRIYGISPEKDTLEVPYLLKRAGEKREKVNSPFRLLNQSKNAQGYFYTFALADPESSINQIKIDFGLANFDFRVSLEGSQDQKEWFTLQENIRFVGIRNALTDYHFTQVRFPEAQYAYYRLQIKTTKDPKLRKAYLTRLKTTDQGNYREIPFTVVEKDSPSVAKTDQYTFELPTPAVLSELRLTVTDDFDYYRPLRLEYLADSFKTEKGWKYRYQPLLTTTLTSLEETIFRFTPTLTRKFRLSIQNQDNPPLSLTKVEARIPEHYLAARFTGFPNETNYILAYGNTDARPPRYDLARFSVPESLTACNLGEVRVVEKIFPPKTSPLIENEVWLWLVMGVLILVLGGFSWRMMQKKEA